MTGILQIKNDKYYAVLDIKKNGKRTRKWISTGLPVKNNSRKAAKVLRELIDEYEAQESEQKVEVLFSDFVLKWLSGRRNKIDDVTWEGYESVVMKHIYPYFKETGQMLSEITVDDIEAYYNVKSVSGRMDGRPGGLSKRSIKIHATILNMIFNEGIRKRLINTNPCTVAELPAKSDKSFKGTFLTERQCKALLSALEGTMEHDLVQITLLYGLRRSELMGLKWDSVDFERGTLAIKHTVVTHKGVHEKDKTKNNSSNRIYPLLDSAKVILLKQRDQQEAYRSIFKDSYQESGYIFTKADGSPFHPSYPSHELQKVLDKHEELPRIRFHDLRHTCASLLFDLGWSMKDVSEWLGHSTIAITMDTYTHIDANRKTLISKGIDNMFSQKASA